ncbi:MAG: CRISPR-associated RAMP protein Csx7 [Thermodesulfovibrionales bacterium]
MFERLDNRYFFRGKLILENEMHIGSGRGDGTTDALVVKDFNGIPYIPGSSLRGVLRSTIERIASSIGLNPCLLEEDNPCVTTSKALQHEFKELLKGKNYSEITAFLTDSTKVCPVCQLFGSTVVASKIRITDLSLNGTFNTTAVRHGVAINRDTETAQDKAKFDFETVPKGIRFDFELIGENLVNKDLSLLALGIQEMVDGNFWLGGNTARGLGKCKLEELEIKYFDNLKEYLTNGKKFKKLEYDDFTSKISDLIQG